MADNYLERQYNDYLAGKAKAEQKRKALWRKRLEEYRRRLKAEGEQSTDSGEKP